MLTDIQKEIVKVLQEDLPNTKEPFVEIGNKIGISEEALLNEINYLIDKGYLRRMGAVLAHRKIGLNYNPMIVIETKEEYINDLGEKIAAFTEVTHCYNRPRMDDFPYDLYAMIHCNSQEEVSEIVKKITNDDRIISYKLLYSTKEYKKTSMKYFI
ncbi:MAG: Lrp/AsnC family transcriptional regulator [Eubacteriales bacterium]|nr:Lrp/AsnC family transcriptional regulator [Eubacteriales bacterium]NCC81292.1 Lrp/AsnC family transcriptional regulator [Clostridia bacterium]